VALRIQNIKNSKFMTYPVYITDTEHTRCQIYIPRHSNSDICIL